MTWNTGCKVKNKCSHAQDTKTPSWPAPGLYVLALAALVPARPLPLTASILSDAFPMRERSPEQNKNSRQTRPPSQVAASGLWVSPALPSPAPSAAPSTCPHFGESHLSPASQIQATLSHSISWDPACPPESPGTPAYLSPGIPWDPSLSPSISWDPSISLDHQPVTLNITCDPQPFPSPIACPFSIT